MHTGELSERIGVSRETVRLWTQEYGEFLSRGAVGNARNAKRVYDERDALILASVADARARGLDPPEIKAELKSGKLVGSVPSIASEDEKEARKSVALVPASEYQRLADLIRVKEDEINRIRDERDKALESAHEANERVIQMSADFNQRINALTDELGEMRGKLGALESERLPMATTLRLIVAVVLGLVVLLFIAVLVLSGRGG